MTRANAWTIIIGILLVVLPYLLTQSEIDVPGIAKVLIQAAILAVGVIARYLPAEGSTQKVEITGPVPVTQVPPEPVAPEPPEDVPPGG